MENPEDPKVARIWYELANMQRYDLQWEWMAESDGGEYLKREEVLAAVARFLSPTDEAAIALARLPSPPPY